MATANSTRKPISTELQLEHLKPIGKTYDVKVANTPGLAVRVGKSGTKSFRWDRGSKHKPRIITHGTFPQLSLADARKAHQKAQQQHKSGTLALNVALGNLNKSVSAETPEVVADLCEMFYADALRDHKRPEKARRVLDVDILPVIGEMKLEAVTPMVARAVIKLVVDRGATSYAGRVKGILKQVFDYGVELGLMESNPAMLNSTRLGIQNNARDRKLSSDEIATLWPVLDNASLVVGTALKLLLLLGVRSGELRLAEWEHVDLDAGLLTIPVKNQKLKKEQAKRAHPFVVSLSDYAISLFRGLEGLSDKWVFIGRSNTPLSDSTLPQFVRVMKAGIDPFRPHDLRRTMRTGLAKLGIEPHIAERCLNHSLGKIEATYNRHDYMDERREALERWSQHVQVVTGQHVNVVEMRRHG